MSERSLERWMHMLPCGARARKDYEALQAEIERLKITAPDYVRVRIAKRLAGAEYIHQKLWAHSWEEAGRVMDPEKL